MDRANLAVAERALGRMARALDRLHSLELAGSSSGNGRYETATNGYEAQLEAAYEKWVKGLGKVTGEGAREQINAALDALQRTLRELGQANLPDTLSVLGHAYLPSPDAFSMLAEAIRENDATITGRLIPDLRAKLYRALEEEADLSAVARSLASRVTGLAGLYWATIQRAIGDFAAQAQTADDELYECRWVLDPGAEHCEACTEFAGTYDSYNAMLAVTRECVPGYFFGYPGRACWSNCRCHLELQINGKWSRV